MMFHDGRMIRGKWSKDGLDGALTLSNKAGDLMVPPGHTWIELVPVATGSVEFK